MVSDTFVSNPSAADHSMLATILEKTSKRVTSLSRRMKTLDICSAWQNFVSREVLEAPVCGLWVRGPAVGVTFAELSWIS